MELVSFQNTRFGEWIVKLSYIRDYDSFVLVAFHMHDQDIIIKSFQQEHEVVTFVNYLGEKYE